jgi:F-box-like
MDLPPDSLESYLRAVENKIKCLEESAHAMKVYRNTLVPISCLPTEILSIIFCLLPSFEVLDIESCRPILSSPASHVCHRWREISLNLPYLWSRINFTKLTPAGAAVMLVRAKTAPLYLEALTIQWNRAKFKAFKEQVEAHIHHIRHLSILGTRKHLKIFGQLVLSAPSLELLSIDDRQSARVLSPVIMPDSLFDGIAPKLTYLRLYNCGIRWQSPLLKGVRDLELILLPAGPAHARIKFYSWLRALKQMPQLERLVLHGGIPSDLVVLSEGLKLTVDLPSLTEFSISASVGECAVVLAHLVLPALTRLCVDALIDLDLSVFGSVNDLIQCVAQNAHGPQDTEALQSLFIGDNKGRADFVAWTMPRQDSGDGLHRSIDLPDRTRPARLEFSIQRQYWPSSASEIPVDIQQYNALLAALPLNSVMSLTVKGCTPLSKEDWRSHVSRWHKLERVRLFYAAVAAFRGMFEDAALAVLGGPLFPSLEELILSDISLNAQRVYYLRDMLMECVEIGILLGILDLRTCTAAASDRAVQLLSEIVVDVQGPVMKESGDLNGRRRGSAGVLGEEGGGDEEGDEEPGFHDVPTAEFRRILGFASGR